ncbi:RasGEF domain containing protein [Tritrichomonas foetus]|uniref:RasGEF domain containing protein n=1 Tax=Tritrichomonas foetus TaxID=1144522 RepID=A0A1J4K9F3_9EUKA|nr:RasGEF domain containing protein [Tritrichomonas foetus]|eukprot:OHT07536.1 RasGEF domain containing protein [Tritrichomonas foetus]
MKGFSPFCDEIYQTYQRVCDFTLFFNTKELMSLPQYDSHLMRVTHMSEEVEDIPILENRPLSRTTSNLPGPFGQQDLNNNNVSISTNNNTKGVRSRAPTVGPNRKQILDSILNKKDEERSTWLTNSLLKTPEYLALRESALPYVGGYSFSNIKHTVTVNASSSINRYTTLDLIFQHLQTIGMYQTADILSKESGHAFQSNDSLEWDRSDLRLITSLAVSHKENAWDIKPKPNHIYSKEYFECIEDEFSACPYRENPLTIWDELHNPNLNVVYSKQRSQTYGNVIAASLKRIIIFQLMNDGVKLTKEDQGEFFLALQSITSYEHFLEHLICLFDCDLSNTRYQPLSPSVVRNIQMAVISLIRCWIWFHGNYLGETTLNRINGFADRVFNDKKFIYAHKGVQIIREQIKNKHFYGVQTKNLDDPPEPAIDLNSRAIFLSSLTILGPEPLEVARQITLLFHQKFSKISSYEFIIGLKNRKTTVNTPSLLEFFLMNDNLSQIIAKTFLDAENKSYAYLKLVAIARNLRQLGNLDSLAVFLRLILRDDIKMLGRPSDAIVMEMNKIFRECGDFDKKETIHPTLYEKVILERISNKLPTIPNLYAEIKSTQKALLKQPDYIDGLMNWEKTKTLAKRCSIIFRFQNCVYNFIPIPQIQKVITKEVILPFDQFEKLMYNKIKDFQTFL